MAKKSKSALPKKIGGVKVPKALRKSGVGGFLASPLGKALALDAVLALGTGVAAKESKRGSATRRLLKGAGDTGEATAEHVGAAAATLSHALSEAARAFNAALQEGEHREPRPATIAWETTPEPLEPKPSKKKSASFSDSPKAH